MKAKPRPDPIIKKDHALIPVRNGNQWLWAKIDIEDLERVKKYNWSLSGTGHIHAGIQDKAICIHNFILRTNKLIDHLDGIRLNNQRSNLRLCTKQENNWNQRKTKNQRTSKYKGVCLDKGRNKFRSTISLNNNQIWIGYFDTETEAASAYDEKARELFGKFGRFNFPKENEQSVFI